MLNHLLKNWYQFFSNDDIVLQKLIDIGKNNMVETYYKVILKYLFGKTLLEIDQSLYSNLLLIFKLRNEIMHKGYLNQESFIKVGIDELDHETSILILNRLNATIRNVAVRIKNGEPKRNISLNLI